jgi:hypothetical protein
MIDFAMTTPIDDAEIHHFPIEIISEILQQVKIFFSRKSIIDQILVFFSKNLIYHDMSMRM